MRIIGNNPQLSRQTQGTASGAITGGKPVLVNTDGTVTQISEVTQAVGTAVKFENAEIGNADITFDSNSNRVVIAYKDEGNSNAGTAIVGSVNSSDNSIAFGTAVVFESGNCNQPHITFDSNSNRVVIAYMDSNNSSYGTAIVGSVNSSDNSIAFGTAVVFLSAAVSGEPVTVTFDSNVNRVVIAYDHGGDSQKGYAIVGSVDSSDNSIAFGTHVKYENSGVNNAEATFDSNSNKIVIAYRSSLSGSAQGKAIVGTVDASDNSISYGTAAVIASVTANHITSTFDSNSNKVVVAYRDSSNSNVGTAAIGTISGTDISFGTPVVFNAASTYYPGAGFDSENNKVVISYSNGSNYGTVITGAISGTTISFDTALVITGSNQAFYLQNAFDTNSNRSVISYFDRGDSDHGKASVFKTGVSTNITSENFIGFAEDTVATGQPVTVNTKGAVDENQTSLTPAQQYFVQTDGTLGTSAGSPSVVAGTAVTATKLIVKG